MKPYKFLGLVIRGDDQGKLEQLNEQFNYLVEQADCKITYMTIGSRYLHVIRADGSGEVGQDDGLPK